MAGYDDCTFCGGRVTEQRVPKACWWGNQLIAIVADVPTGVCEQCGERYYKAEVLKQIEELLKNRPRFQSVEVPMIEYSAKAVR